MQHQILFKIALFLIFGATTWANGQEKSPDQKTGRDDKRNPTVTMEIPYNPPGSPPVPNTRITSAVSRSTGYDGLKVTLAMPEHVAYTVSPHPTLYWFFSQSVVDRTVVVTLIDDNKPIDSAGTPLLEQIIGSAATRGLHELDLSALNPPVRLEAGKRYKWSVSVRNAEYASSADLVAEAYIQRVPESTALKAAHALNDGDQLAALYGINGIWIDAFHRGSPAAKSKLLELVGL